MYPLLVLIADKEIKEAKTHDPCINCAILRLKMGRTIWNTIYGSNVLKFWNIVLQHPARAAEEEQG